MKKTALLFKPVFLPIALLFTVLLVSACPATMSGSGGGASSLNPTYIPIIDGNYDNDKFTNDQVACTHRARQTVTSGGGVSPSTGTMLGAGGGAVAGGLIGSRSGSTGEGMLLGAGLGALLGLGATADNQNQGASMAKLNQSYYNCLSGRGWNPINTP